MVASASGSGQELPCKSHSHSLLEKAKPTEGGDAKPVPSLFLHGPGLAAADYTVGAGEPVVISDDVFDRTTTVVSLTGGPSSDGQGNSGHGNNEDGVDSSNPGQGGGGPTGGVDPSGDFDDELKDKFDVVNYEGTFSNLGDYATHNFKTRHPLNPWIGNVLFADGHVESRQDFSDLTVDPSDRP